MAQWVLNRYVDLRNNIGFQSVGQARAVRGESNAHTWRVTVMDGMAAANLDGYSAQCSYIRPDGGTIYIDGSISGNVVEIVFPAACYAYVGTGSAILRLINNAAGVNVVIDGLMFTIDESETDVVIDPGNVVPSLSELLAQMDAMVSAENARVEAENARVAAEEIRAAFYDGFSSQLAENTSLLNELNAPILTAPYDYLSGANNGYLSHTSRWMLNKTVPAGVTIDTVQLQIASVAAGTVEVDGWTLASGTYTRVFHKTKATNAIGTLTVDVDFETTAETYITVCTTEAIFVITYNTAHGNSNYLSGDKTSTSFPATGLNVFPNLAPNVKVNCVQSNKAIDRLNTYGRKLGAILTVDANGHGDYTTIQAAVNAAPDGATILIYPGTYHEQVACFGRVIHLVGMNKQTCILYDDSADYATPPLELGNGSVQNMTIIEDHSNPAAGLVGTTNWELAYCVHVEDFTGCYNKGAVTLIDNCILRNTKRAALGMGTYKGHTIIVRNCDIYSGAPTRVGDYHRGAVYFHSMAADFDGQGQRVKFINTTIRCADDVAIYIGDPSHAGYTADMEVEFINTHIWSETAGKADSIIVNPFSWSTVVSLAESSYGNNVAMLNA